MPDPYLLHSPLPESARSVRHTLRPAGRAEPDPGAAATRLRNSALRPTRPRLGVLTELMRATPRCLDAAQLMHELLPQFERLTPATVYRALNDLWEAGLLLRSRTPQGHTCYGLRPDAAAGPADTLVCLCKGEMVVLVISDQALHERLRALAGAAGCALQQNAPLTLSLACADTGTGR